MENYCKSCEHDEDIGFCDKCFYNHILEERGIPPTEYKARPQPKTNADRIRAMTDEELARGMSGLESFALTCGGGWPPEKWLDWLKQEEKNEQAD